MFTRILVILALIMQLGACSIEEAPKGDGKDGKDSGSGSGTSSSGSTPAANGAAPSKGSDPQAVSDEGGYLTGYVVSAFDMQVNGESFTDSEDFYTHEMQDLTDQVQAAGYDGYTMSFDGQLGLDDLKYGMDVYVAAEGKTGFAGDTKVNDSGRFMLAIPNGSGDETFKVRTNKRVSVILTSPDKKKTVKWCYNFSSVNAEATLHDPVQISDFSTTLTKYQCANATGGLTIPQNSAPVAAPKADPAAPDVSGGDRHE